MRLISGLESTGESVDRNKRSTCDSTSAGPIMSYDSEASAAGSQPFGKHSVLLFCDGMNAFSTCNTRATASVT